MHSRLLSCQTAELARRFRRCPSVLVSALTVIATIVAGCESSTSTVTTGPTPPKCQLALSPPANIVADGGTGAVTVTAQPECAWTVTTPANWITDLSPTSGQGNGTVEFRVVANPAATMREGEIVVNDNRVRVMQEAAPCQFTIAPVNQTTTSDADNASVTVSAMPGCTWTARSNAEWITITSSASGDGNGTVAFRVSSNTGGARTGTLTIADRTHTVTQQAAGQAPSPAPPPPIPNCSYAIAPTSMNAAAGGGGLNPVTVTTTAGCPWTAVSNAPWIAVTSGASGNGSGAVGLSATFNPGAARSGTVTIAGQTFTLTQNAPAPVQCTYELNPSSASIPALGGAGSFAVGAPPGCAWSASNNASWISFTSSSSGSGSGSVGFLVLPNLGGARSGAIVVSGQTFTISQAAVLPASGQTFTITPGP
jgi:hypothetical protein